MSSLSSSNFAARDPSSPPSTDQNEIENENELVFSNESKKTKVSEATKTTKTAKAKGGKPVTNATTTTTTTKKNDNIFNLLETIPSLQFPINVECTSLLISPSGHFLWGGFSDGTIRVFDLTDQFGLEHDEVVQAAKGGPKTTLLVASKWCQSYGAVACQIHARGVHTDLQTQVTSCGNYIFGGVQRGAVELYAMDVQALEGAAASNNMKRKRKNILDYIKVHVHSDAKLKGLGASIELKNQSRPTFLLLTGRGIKNIHIWKFQPPIDGDDVCVWEQLYDTQTNGNTIHMLSFYRSPTTRQLYGVSKSDCQKLRLWDLTHEEEAEADRDQRPKRPKYQDVVNSQAALGMLVSGSTGRRQGSRYAGFCVCGGNNMYNQFSIVSLDQPRDAFNHTELALPGGGGSGGRQRRGDLKQVMSVATVPSSHPASSHALLELDDSTLVLYTGSDSPSLRDKSQSQLTVVTPSKLPPLPADFWRRTMCLASGVGGALVAAIGMYNPNTQKGHVVLRILQRADPKKVMSVPVSSSLRLPKEERTSVLLISKKKRKKSVSKVVARPGAASTSTPTLASKVLNVESVGVAVHGSKKTDKLPKKKSSGLKYQISAISSTKENATSSSNSTNTTVSARPKSKEVKKTTAKPNVPVPTKSFPATENIPNIEPSKQTVRTKVTKNQAPFSKEERLLNSPLPRSKIVPSSVEKKRQSTPATSDNKSSASTAISSQRKTLVSRSSTERNNTTVPIISASKSMDSLDSTTYGAATSKPKPKVPVDYSPRNNIEIPIHRRGLSAAQVSPDSNPACKGVSPTATVTSHSSHEEDERQSIMKFLKPKRVVMTHPDPAETKQNRTTSTKSSEMQKEHPDKLGRKRKREEDSSANAPAASKMSPTSVLRGKAEVLSFTPVKSVKINTIAKESSTTKVFPATNILRKKSNGTLNDDLDRVSGVDHTEMTKPKILKIKLIQNRHERKSDIKARQNQPGRAKNMNETDESSDECRKRKKFVASADDDSSIGKEVVSIVKRNDLVPGILQSKAETREPKQSEHFHLKRLSKEEAEKALAVESVDKNESEDGSCKAGCDERRNAAMVVATDPGDKTNKSILAKRQEQPVAGNETKKERKARKRLQKLLRHENNVNSSFDSTSSSEIDQETTKQPNQNVLDASTKARKQIIRHEQQKTKILSFSERLEVPKPPDAMICPPEPPSSCTAQDKTIVSSAKRMKTVASKALAHEKKPPHHVNIHQRLNKQNAGDFWENPPPTTKSPPPKRHYNTKKQPRREGKQVPDIDVANILCDLKSPTPSLQREARDNNSNQSPSRSLESMPPSSSPLRSREEVVTEKVRVQYEQLRLYIDSLPSSTSPTNAVAEKFRRLCPPVNDYKASIKKTRNRQQSRRDKLMREHRTSHELIQKRLLRAAQHILRLLMENHLSIDEARADLKATVKSFEEVLYDTLRRQEFETDAFLASQLSNEPHLSCKVPFEFQSSFRRVEAIYEAIEPPRRLPGRPRSTNQALF